MDMTVRVGKQRPEVNAVDSLVVIRCDFAQQFLNFNRIHTGNRWTVKRREVDTRNMCSAFHRI
ncbi:hypothetical protein EYF80_040726 [Liparis tanakae]|uniref:Uncharacterized protein n=1 Tax=Liparis tanakae TaxID=230148 RepID=A0A4Z2G6C6_9TELE|nr:hypothetical protein EYF80_040726 [Liparis tanakae]